MTRKEAFAFAAQHDVAVYRSDSIESIVRRVNSTLEQRAAREAERIAARSRRAAMLARFAAPRALRRPAQRWLPVYLGPVQFDSFAQFAPIAFS